MTLDLPFPELDAPMRLLVVDDQEFDRKMICMRLREVAPPETLLFESDTGQATLDAIQHEDIPFDCVLLDMNLPDIHGLELTSKILAICPEISIVMITVEADMQKAMACLKAGAEDFLIKGEYTNIGLYRAVRYAIERHRAALENFKLSNELSTERELSAAQKEFIHLVSHEFRTPIAIVSGAVQLLAAKAPELYAGAGANQFKKINDALARLIGLLDNVLRLSKVEDGKEAFTPNLFDMTHTIQMVLENFDSTRIRSSVAPAPLHYMGDQRLVEYALHNVVSNALKYSPADAQVDISVHETPESIEIIVVDKGAGMSPEMLARAGEKFHRDTRTSHIEGTGLGLHLARRFMDHHHGTLKFESALGEGTTARLLFPKPKA